MLDALDRLFTDARMRALGAILGVGLGFGLMAWAGTALVGGTLSPAAVGLFAGAAYSMGRTDGRKDWRKDA